jgi:hypothetical protein
MEFAESRADMQAGRPGSLGLRLGALLVDDGAGASGSSGMQQHLGLMDDEIKDGEGRTPRIPGKGQGKIW